MSYYGEDEWEGTFVAHRPRPQHGYSSRDQRRSQQYLNPDAFGTSLHRSRSQGHGPAPIINVYNDMNQDNMQRSASPGYVPYPAYPEERRRRSSSRSRGRTNSRLGEELMADEMASLAIENARLRSRSRGRSDFTGLHSTPGWAEYEAERLRREIDERERRMSQDRAEERIRNDYKIKALEEEAKRTAAEQKAKTDRERMIAEYEKKKRDEEEERKAAEKAWREKVEREKREKEEEEKRQWEEFERKRKEKEEKKKREEKEEEERVEHEMRKRLEKQGYSLTYIDAIIKGENIKGKAHQPSISPGRTTIERRLEVYRGSQPVYPKIHRDYLAIDTLLFYDIPYEIDRDDPNYIIILRDMDKHETDVLFEHTKRIRSRTLLIEDKKEKPQYAWYRKKERSRSRSGRREVSRVGILELK